MNTIDLDDLKTHAMRNTNYVYVARVARDVHRFCFSGGLCTLIARSEARTAITLFLTISLEDSVLGIFLRIIRINIRGQII